MPERLRPARILVTRPEPDATEQARDLAASGHKPVVSPLLRINTLDAPIAPTASRYWSGIVATSRNALRAIAHNPGLQRVRNTRIFTVGPETTAVAREIGFSDIVAGNGDAADLVQTIEQSGLTPDHGALLRLAGERPNATSDTLSDNLGAAGFELEIMKTYRVAAVPRLSAAAREALCNGALDIVLLMSPLTATTYSAAIKAAGLTVQSDTVRYVCLSEAVAERLDDIPRTRVFVADKPNRTAFRTILDRAVAELP